VKVPSPVFSGRSHKFFVGRARAGLLSVSLHGCSLTDCVSRGDLRAPPLSVTRSTRRVQAQEQAHTPAPALALAGTRVLAGSGLVVSWSCFWHLTWNPPTRDNCCVAGHFSFSLRLLLSKASRLPPYTVSLAFDKQAAVSPQSDRLHNPRHLQPPSTPQLALQSRPTSPNRPLVSTRNLH